MKTFKYEFITEKVYLGSTDEFEEYGEDFYFTVTDEDLISALANLLYLDYFKPKTVNEFNSYNELVVSGLKSMLSNIEITEIIEEYEDALKEYFEEDARNEYKYER